MTDDLSNFWDKQYLLKIVLPSVQAVLKLLFEFQEITRDAEVTCFFSPVKHILYFRKQLSLFFSLCVKFARFLSYV